MKRREFIILSGIGATSASLLSACGHPEEKLIPALIPDDEYVPGIDYWKASTCGMCPAGCGIIVRTREHKANKIEGNPLHPVNRGALCARGQAGLEVLYNPDRIKSPMKRVGERGEGKWEEISWDEAIKTLADKLREIKVLSGGPKIIFSTRSARGVIAVALELFRSAYGERFIATEESLTEESASYWGDYRRSVTPVFDLGNASYLLSFGARFLETWHSPVMYSLAYGEFRRTGGKARGKFAQVEPRMSLTGANADEWLPAAVGSEGLVALAIAQVIIREGLIRNATPPDFLEEPLDAYAPENTSSRTDIPPARIIRLAREFAASERPLAIGTGTGGTTELRQLNSRPINYLNALVGNLNKPGGVLFPAHDFFDALERLYYRAGKIPETLWLESMARLTRVDGYKALLVHNINPAHFLPRSIEWLKSMPFIASFSSMMDETTKLADLILPDNSPLENWDLRTTQLSGTLAAVSISRPVITPDLNTRQTADVLLALSREFGHGPARSSPFDSVENIVKSAAGELPKPVGAADGSGATDAFDDLVERGVWVGEATGRAEQYGPPKSRLSLLSMQGAPASEEFPLTLLTYEHPTLGDGERASLPSLQELPDPMTSVLWGSWIEINSETAAKMGISDGDLVEVTTEHGSVHVPAALYPAIRPEVIAMPYGQGHTASGRFANGRGANAALLNPFAIKTSGREETVRARLSKAGGKANLIRFGTELQERMEKRR